MVASDRKHIEVPGRSLRAALTCAFRRAERLEHDKSVENLQKMGMPSGAVAQLRALPDTIDQARHSWPVPAVPVVVLTSGKPLGAWPLATADDMQRWLELHNKLVAKIPGAQHIVFPKADHINISKVELSLSRLQRW
jgi:hypothetical protein